jgi:hypothetical protein
MSQTESAKAVIVPLGPQAGDVADFNSLPD